MRKLLVLSFAISAIAPIYGQFHVPCAIAAAPNLVRANGEAELVADLFVNCDYQVTLAPLPTVFVDITLFLNTEVTSRVMDPANSKTDVLLLIDDPQPGVPNESNNFPYVGQVLGTPGFVPGSGPDGNVYQGVLKQNNAIVFQEIPFNPNGSRTFRIVNLRANASILGPGAPILVNTTMNPSMIITIDLAGGAGTTVALVMPAMTFSSEVSVKNPSMYTLHFDETFASALKKRIENNNGPLSAAHQDVPGTFYCTESGFTPEFSMVNPNAIGSATTGTRLLAHFKKIHPSVGALVVPQEVMSSTGELVAHLVLPVVPFGADFSGGAVSQAPGMTLLQVPPSQTVNLLYEVTAAAPFMGVNGCAKIQSFDIAIQTLHPINWKNVDVSGSMVPLDPMPGSGATTAAPRFMP